MGSRRPARRAPLLASRFALLVAACAGPTEVGRDADLAAIAALHERDERASLEQDPEALAALWTRDGVMLPPGAGPLRGADLFERLRAAGEPIARYEVLEYAFEPEEIEVVGDHAFEWGLVRGRTRDRSTGEVVESRFQLLRVLRREGGEWRVHRAIWNEAAP